MRQIFTSSPADPRYHMLSHMSAKFAQPAKFQLHEPRAALFLNRFTRTLTIMYATSGIQEILGIPSANLRGRSFYYCIAENCLADAIKCLESAKSNDSIAYLRFWFRDPRQDDSSAPSNNDSDEDMTEIEELTATDTSVDDESTARGSEGSPPSESPAVGRAPTAMEVDDEMLKPESSNSPDESNRDTHEAIFGDTLLAESSSSSMAASPEINPRGSSEPVELEAVISCTSDGLVVCLRKARPMIPHPTSHRPSKPVYADGLFAAPWASDPIIPPIESRPGHGFGTTFAPSLSPQGAQHNNLSPTRSPFDHSDFMGAIRDQAIFAWGVTGINGALADVGRGQPVGAATPEQGYPVWASDPQRLGKGLHSGKG